MSSRRCSTIRLRAVLSAAFFCRFEVIALTSDSIENFARAVDKVEVMVGHS